MTSKRIFELVNILHHTLSDNTLLFAGNQVILVGDFSQLKPIRTPFYESELFERAFPHRFELKQVVRQGETERRLIEAMDQLRYGKCDKDTEEYLCSLVREGKSREVVHM